ncbi:MAG: restriction endonuclease subunit S [Gammaproteobacteria bacterium]|nr:restriction endonuclease subunit S [Gammaproteobacteria bacterium]
MGSFSPALNAWRTAIKKGDIQPHRMGEVISGIRYGTGTPPLRVEPSGESVPFLRATDIKDGQVLTEKLPYISRNQPPAMDKCRLEGGELIIVRSGVNTGDCAVVPKALHGAFAAYDLIVNVNTGKALAEFLSAFLYTGFGSTQIDSVKNRAAQPHINAEEVKALEIPLPPLDVQCRLVAELDAARTERDRALAEADRLLTSIDDLVKAKLGLPDLEPPKQAGYAIRLTTAMNNNTLSADFFHPERMQAVRLIQSLTNAPLSQIVNFQRNIIKTPGESRYIGLASVAAGTGQLTEAVETASGQCFSFKPGDVLYGRLRPYLNKVWLATFSGVCSTEFHVMRPFDERILRPEYLAVVMRTSLIVAQTKHMMTGNTHPRIANEDVANLLVPLTDEKTQQKIVEETLASQAESARLRTHAETIWREAREHFEQQLLQGGKA